MNDENKVSNGLEGVRVAATELSEVDGAAGRLIVAGHPIEEAGASLSFEAMCAELWSIGLARPVLEEEVKRLLAKERALAAGRWIARHGDGGITADGMAFLRSTLSLIDIDGLADLEACARITASAAVLAAAWARARRGVSPEIPLSTASHAEDYLRLAALPPSPYQASGGANPPPSPISPIGLQGRGLAEGLNTYLVTVSDHGLNASTFTARVIASTGSDLVSAIVGAVGSLKGPLHGGAPGPVLDMLDAVGSPQNATRWVEEELSAGRRIMGMGHRVYRVRDPRAKALEAALEKISGLGTTPARLELARAVEVAALRELKKRHPDRPLEANVEFYTALLLEAVGLDRAQFSPTFAVGRIAGWCAHYYEQRRTGRLIRPDSVYIGRRPSP